MYNYSYYKYHEHRFYIEDIRYFNLRNYVNLIFKREYFNNLFIRKLFKNNLNIILNKDFDYTYLMDIKDNNTFYNFWYNFCLNYIMTSKLSYKLIKIYSKNLKDKKRFINYNKLFYFFSIYDKNKYDFFDFHDFYFFEPDIYNELYEVWTYHDINNSNIMHNIVSSRITQKLIYSHLKGINAKIMDNEYKQMYDKVIGDFIKLNDIDNKYFGSFNILELLNVDRIVSTKASYESIEKNVFEDWEDFLEHNWQKDHLDTDVLSLYYNLSSRLHKSLFEDEEFEFEDKYDINYLNLIVQDKKFNGKLILKGDLNNGNGNYWCGVFIIMPMIVFYYFYRFFFFFMIGNHKLIYYVYEYIYIIPFFFYYLSNSLFFIIITSRYLYFKKLFKKKRKPKPINVTKFHEACYMVEEESVFNKILLFFFFNNYYIITYPSYDFFIFYLLFIFFCIFILKIIEVFSD